MAEQTAQQKAAAAQRRRAEQQRQQTQAEAAKALAEQQRAQAEASRVDAETRRVNAAAEAARAQAKVDADNAERAARIRREEAEFSARQERERSGKTVGERAYQIGLNITAPVAGIAAGHYLARHLETRHVAHLAAASPQIAALGAEAKKLVSQQPTRVAAIAQRRSQLQGVVSAAKKLGINKVRGPIGLTTAGLLLAEGAFSRFVLANQVDNEAAKELLRVVGTASAFAATNLIGERLVQNATLKKLPNAVHFANLEAAQAALKAAPKATPAVATVPVVKPANKIARAALAAPRVQAGMALARRLAPTVLRAGGVAGGAVAIAYAASQTSAGQAAIAKVRGFFRTDSTTGRTSYVRPHTRNLG